MINWDTLLQPARTLCFNQSTRIKFKEMRELVGVQDVKNFDFKIKRENVEDNLEVSLTTKLT